MMRAIKITLLVNDVYKRRVTDAVAFVIIENANGPFKKCVFHVSDCLCRV